MSYRDFAKRHPWTGEWIIPAICGVAVFFALWPAIGPEYAALLGILADGFVGNLAQ